MMINKCNKGYQLIWLGGKKPFLTFVRGVGGLFTFVRVTNIYPELEFPQIWSLPLFSCHNQICLLVCLEFHTVRTPGHPLQVWWKSELPT